MTASPQHLSRPLAARVAALSDPPASVDAEVASTALIAGANAALAAGKTKYADRAGILGLRQWVAADLNRRYQLGMSADAVTITCGVEEALFIAVTCLGHGGQVMFPLLPTDSLVYLPQWETVADDLLNRLDAAQHILWDMRQGDAPNHPAQNPELAPRTVSIGVFPAVGEGWRVGWLAGHADHAQLRAYKQSLSICTPSVSQWAVLAHLEATPA
jgi:DNA-binding transcriptional MocR family regulator